VVVEEAAEEEVFVFLRRVDDLGAGAGFAFGAVGAVGGGAFDDEPRFMFNPANLASREFRSMVVVQDYYKPGKLFFFACLQRVFDLVDVTRSKKNTPKQSWDILLLLAHHTQTFPSHRYRDLYYHIKQTKQCWCSCSLSLSPPSCSVTIWPIAPWFLLASL